MADTPLLLLCEHAVTPSPLDSTQAAYGVVRPALIVPFSAHLSVTLSLYATRPILASCFHSHQIVALCWLH